MDESPKWGHFLVQSGCENEYKGNPIACTKLKYGFFSSLRLEGRRYSLRDGAKCPC